MKHYYKTVDYIQWIWKKIWKKIWNIDKSKAQIRRDLEQGAVKLNDQKLTVDDIIEIEIDDKGKD